MSEEKTDIALDLDALSSPNVQINFKGQTIAVEAPDLTQYAKIVNFGELLTKMQEQKDMTQLASLYTQIDGLLKELIPGLVDSKLNFTQITALFRLVASLGAPTDKAVAKLKEMGVEIKGDDSPKDSTSLVQ